MGAIFKEGFSFSGYERDLLTWNRGAEGFLNISGVSGVDSISDGRGAVFADFDNDGDTDILLTTVQGEAHYLFRNNVGNQNGFLRVELVGGPSGKDAYGAVVKMSASAGPLIKIKAGGSGYISQSDPRLLFGLGSDTVARDVQVTWPGGQAQAVGDVPAGQSIRIVEGREGYESLDERRFALADPLSAEDVFLTRIGFREGQPFPDLALTDLEGRRSRLSDTRRAGRKQLINLWATWCVPCAKEMPRLEELYPQLTSRNIDLIGISVDADTQDQVPTYIAQRDISYPVVLSDTTDLESLFPTGEVTVPISVLLDENGIVTEIYSGWSARTESEILSLATRP